MHQLRELLRLHFDEGLSQRLIARGLSVVRSTVERVLKRFVAAGLAWPLDPDLSDEELERRLYCSPAHQGAAKRCARPNYAEVSKQLARKGVTRRLLWAEYRERHDDGIGYSVFCDELAAHLADRDLAYRHHHVPGEWAYFDFAGLTLRYRDGDGVRDAQIFAAALNYSNAIFAYAYPDQTAASWLDGQHRAFVAYGGVPKIAVPDNPKALVAKPNRYEPTLSAVYADFGRHYGITILPARVRKPKDKGAVEGAVKVIEMRILASARDRVFASRQCPHLLHCRLCGIGQKARARRTVGAGVVVDLGQQETRQRDIDPLRRRVDAAHVDLHQHPHPTALVFRVFDQRLQRGRRRNSQPLPCHVALDRLLRHAGNILPVVGSGKATRKIRERHAVSGLFVADTDVNGVQHIASLLPVPTRLPINASQRANGHAFFWVRHRYHARLVGVLELGVTAYLMHLAQFVHVLAAFVRQLYVTFELADVARRTHQTPSCLNSSDALAAWNTSSSRRALRRVSAVSRFGTSLSPIYRRMRSRMICAAGRWRRAAAAMNWSRSSASILIDICTSLAMGGLTR
ncbi:MAG: IS21 family transposase [Xanthomonadaceae bacterium]|nr:IS21 family transposase [Xanthomonadaceae bacterium]MDP2185172.1 IS21 family transposase [Xanthomonadales bacterium]MDZ4117282.1 IS21 family transposase [Xanthomonadaceae bacterium]